MPGALPPDWAGRAPAPAPAIGDRGTVRVGRKLYQALCVNCAGDMIVQVAALWHFFQHRVERAMVAACLIQSFLRARLRGVGCGPGFGLLLFGNLLRGSGGPCWRVFERLNLRSGGTGDENCNEENGLIFPRCAGAWLPPMAVNVAPCKWIVSIISRNDVLGAVPDKALTRLFAGLQLLPIPFTIPFPRFPCCALRLSGATHGAGAESTFLA